MDTRDHQPSVPIVHHPLSKLATQLSSRLARLPRPYWPRRLGNLKPGDTFEALENPLRVDGRIVFKGVFNGRVVGHDPRTGCVQVIFDGFVGEPGTYYAFLEPWRWVKRAPYRELRY